MVELDVAGGLELLGQRRASGPPPGWLVGGEARRGRSRRPGRTPAARNSTSAKSPSRDPAQHLVDHRLQLVGPGRVGDAGDDPRDRRRGPGRPRTRGPRRPGRRTPRSGAGRAATGSRPASRPATPTRPRRWSRCPRCRRGAAAGRRPRRRRCRGRRAPAAWPPGRPPPAARPGRRPGRDRLEVAGRPACIGRWCGRWLTPVRLRRDRCGGQRLADALVADRLRRAELLGPQRDPVLLQHPAHLAQRGRRAAGPRAARRPGGGRPPAGRRPGPSAAGRGPACSSSRCAPLLQRGEVASGSGAAGRARPRPTNPRCTSRASWSRMSVSAGSVASSARPDSALSARAPAVQHVGHRSRSTSRIRGSRSPRSVGQQRVVRRLVADRSAGRRPRPARRRGGSPRPARRPRGTATRPAPSLPALSRPASTSGRGQREQQQPGDAEPVPGGGLRRRAAHPQPDAWRPRRPAPGSRAPRGRPAARSARSGSSPKVQVVCPVAVGVGGDLGDRRGELRPQRLLERLEVLAAGLLAAARSSTHAVGRPQVLGDLRPVPGLARHDDAGRATRRWRSRASSSGSSPGGTAARNSRAVLGAGTKLTRSCLGRLRIRLGRPAPRAGRARSRRSRRRRPG